MTFSSKLLIQITLELKKFAINNSDNNVYFLDYVLIQYAILRFSIPITDINCNLITICKTLKII